METGIRKRGVQGGKRFRLPRLPIAGPRVHYVPLSRSFEGLREETAVIVDDSRSGELAQMARAARELVRWFSYDNELARVVGALNRYS